MKASRLLVLAVPIALALTADGSCGASVLRRLPMLMRRKCLSLVLVTLTGFVLPLGCGKQTTEPEPRAALPAAPKAGDTFTNPIDGSELMFIPGGEFTMGKYENSPPHEVQVSGFWLAKHEVTNKQWAQFAMATGYRTRAEQQEYAYLWNSKTNKCDKTTGANWRHPRGPG